ncbi:stage II sporulation protein M [Candidatus Arthromitus sp. SFB-rat-Yit]|uniref:stage II sporulation protein M n=1 Tax=Candidatus Arthromitus sp. SFB-rat-Yit TaxID=1041504 RepID=UPI000227A41B|nr:stage II sporulation protein M [Candidatus Arthromitus sp. SFB-rat-Yit]BAK81531.1 putative stage II sporulation protein M [Candidatus Arthromitus sp. SFB-rat-Yit]
MVKSRTLTVGLKDSYNKNFIIYMMVLLFLLCGFLIGVYLFTYLDSELVTYIKNDFIEYMNVIKEGEFSYLSNFRLSSIMLIVPIIIFVLFSANIIFCPLSLVTLSLKGFALGFTTTFLLTNFQLKGVLLTIFTIMLPNMLIIFLYILLCVKSISRGISRTRFRGRFSENDKSITLRFLILFIIFSVLIALLFKCLITPFIIKLIF